MSSDSPLISLNGLNRRGCVQCSSSAPSCPKCDDGYICTMISQSCNQCATTRCVPTSSSSSSGSQGGSGGGSNAGAIAGGVIGGLAFIGIVTFLVWWFFIRGKRQQQYDEQAGVEGQEKRGTFAERASARKSTNSIASTILTRASNVIQIAYIPGVTNRSPPETPGSLVPPVPPLPGAAPDQHFFMPGDLRDSSWTDMTNERRSVAAPSLRSSVATTIYRNNAIVSPMPAQQVTRSRAAVVSIHNGGNGGNGSENPTETAFVSGPDAPAVPAITNAQLAKAGVAESDNNSSIVARTVTAKPVMVKGGAGVKKVNTGSPAPAVQTIEEQPESGAPSAAVSRSNSKATTENKPDNKPQFDHTTSGFDADSDDEDEAPKAKTQTQTPTIVEDSSALTRNESPFADQPSSKDKTESEANTARRSSFLSDTHEGSSRSSRSSGKLPPRVESPFSDANEVKEK